MKAHLCIGGPLDGQFATSMDFDERPWNSRKQKEEDAGMYCHLKEEYAQYNFGGTYRFKTTNNAPSMVWLHKDVVKPSISPKDR